MISLHFVASRYILQQKCLKKSILHRVPEKKQATFIFNITSPSVDILLQFLMHLAWYSLSHSHHRCEAFTWCDVTHDVCQAVARRAQWHQISYHLIMASEFTGLKSCWLFFLEYHAREGIPDMHSEYRWVETSASSGVDGAGPQTYRCNYRTAATPSQCVWYMGESSKGIF